MKLVSNKKFWEEQVVYFRLIRQGSYRIRRDQHSSTVACFHCSGNVFTELLPSNDNGDTHTDAQTNGMDLGSTPLRWVQVP
jgi:hypothetical protein